MWKEIVKHQKEMFRSACIAFYADGEGSLVVLMWKICLPEHELQVM